MLSNNNYPTLRWGCNHEVFGNTAQDIFPAAPGINAFSQSPVEFDQGFRPATVRLKNQGDTRQLMQVAGEEMQHPDEIEGADIVARRRAGGVDLYLGHRQCIEDGRWP